MPQVPTYNESNITRVQAAPNVRVPTNAPAEAFGGGASAAAAGQAVQGLAGQAMQIAKEEKQKADDVATMDAYTKTVQMRNRLMYDPQTGAMNRKGKDAFGVGEEYSQEFNKGADEIEGTLNNDEQRQMYRKIRQNELRDLDSNLTKHTFVEAKKYDEDTTAASIKATNDDAVMNYQDPGKVQQALSTQKALIEAHAGRNGLSPEVTEQQLRLAESKTHSGVIDRMLANGDDQTASKYYSDVKGKLDASDTVQVEKALEEGSTRGKSQRAAMSIVNSNSDLTSALAAVDKISDPKIQDATRERVKQRFSERETAEKMVGEDAFKNAYTIAEQTKSKDSIPPSTWAAMNPAQRNSVDAYLNKGGNIQTNWDDYYNLKQQAANPALRDKFMQTNLLEYRAKLGDTEFKELVGMQTEGKKGNTSQLDGVRSDRQIIDQALSSAGIDPTPKQGTKEAKKVNAFWKAVDDQVRTIQEQTGKKATNQEIQGVVDTLMIEGITKKNSFWFDEKKRLFELDSADKKFEIDIEAVPAAERQKIESALRARNIAVTDQTILNLYGRKMAGMVKRGP